MNQIPHLPLRCLLVSLTLIFVLANPITGDAQIRPEDHQRIRAALSRDDHAAVIQNLQQLQQTAPEPFTKNNYDYLLARILAREGKATEAKRLYQNVIARRSILSSYALWHQAELARLDADTLAEQRLLQRLLSQYPEFLRRTTALQRLATSFFRAGKYREAITTLAPLAGTRGMTARESLARTGEAQLALGDRATARSTFDSLLGAANMDDASLKAAVGLDRIDDAAGTGMTEAERLRRARIYQFNREFSGARKHWLALIDDYPAATARAEACFHLGRGYFLEEKYDEAIGWYQRAYDGFPMTDEGEQGFYFVGHSYQALYDVDRALARYEEFVRLYPQSKYFGYAYLNAIDTLRSANRNEEALRWAARAQVEVRDPFIVTRALFDQAKIRLSQGNFTGALADLNGLSARNLAIRGLVASTNSSEIAFLRAFCYEHLGRFDDAITQYLSLAEGRTDAAGYYGFQATERLRALGANLRAKKLVASRLEGFVNEARTAKASSEWSRAKNSAAQALRLCEAAVLRSEMLQILRTSYSNLPAYNLPSLILVPVGRTTLRSSEADSTERIADELLFLGLFDEGAGELLASQPDTRGARVGNWPYTLAYYCGRGDCPERTLRFAEPILNTIPRDYRLDLMPRTLAEMFFPFPFRESLLEHTNSRNVDPRFLLAVARQESLYDTAAKSPSAARGLLQFIASTSNQIAAQLNLSDFDSSDLYQADRGILIGSQYLKNLFDEFKTPQAVAAAYNGSEDSVRRWMLRAQNPDVDRFVIEVAKRETRDYVFKVINHYRAYQAVYPSPPPK